VFENKDLSPMAVLLLPVVFAVSDSTPIAELKLPVKFNYGNTVWDSFSIISYIFYNIYFYFSSSVSVDDL
jgi:hypothetical protein